MSVGVIAAHAVAGSRYATEVLADSPLGYYRLNETPTSGATLVDSSGLGHDGTWLSTQTSTTGLISGDTNKAVQTSTTNNPAQIPKAAWTEISTVTLEAVIKPATVGSTQSTWDRDPDTSNRVFQFRIETNGALGFLFWTNTSGTTFYPVTSAASLLAAGVKAHVAATYDGTTARTYINGTQVASLAQSGALRTSTNARLQIGFNATVGSARFNGVLDEMAIYGTALSAPRIAAHAALI